MHATRDCAIPFYACAVSQIARQSRVPGYCMQSMENEQEECSLRRDCEKAFHDADEGGRGSLSPEDYKVAVISLMGYKPSKYELATIWKQHAIEGEESQRLSRAAFVEIMLGRLKQQAADDLIRQV